MKLSPIPIRVVRGLVAAVLSGLTCAILVIGIAFGYIFCTWQVEGTTAYNRQVDLQQLRSDLIRPTLGCSVVFACAGWLSFAPCASYRFTRSLGYVFLGSLMFWLILSGLALTPTRYKEVSHPTFYPSELMVLLGPPTLLTIILTAIRIRPTGSDSSS